MTADDFRRLALTLPEAVEQGHMGHPDFRVGGKIFAGLDHSGARATVKLTPDQQDVLMSAEPDMFTPCNGAWGVKGGIKVLPYSSDPKALFSSRRWFLKPSAVPGPRVAGAAASALPALNPNHPTHSSAAPITDNTTLCGGMGIFP